MQARQAALILVHAADRAHHVPQTLAHGGSGPHADVLLGGGIDAHRTRHIAGSALICVHGHVVHAHRILRRHRRGHRRIHRAAVVQRLAFGPLAGCIAGRGCPGMSQPIAERDCRHQHSTPQHPSHHPGSFTHGRRAPHPPRHAGRPMPAGSARVPTTAGVHVRAA